jgi:hypothetical protein
MLERKLYRKWHSAVLLLRAGGCISWSCVAAALTAWSCDQEGACVQHVRGATEVMEADETGSRFTFTFGVRGVL